MLLCQKAKMVITWIEGENNCGRLKRYGRLKWFGRKSWGRILGDKKGEVRKTIRDLQTPCQFN